MTTFASQVYGSACAASTSASQWIASTASIAKANLGAACFKVALFAAAAFERISTASAYGLAQTKTAMIAGYDYAACAASAGFAHAKAASIASYQYTKAAAIAGYSQASTLAKAGFAFAQAHPVQVGLGISALVLTAVLAVAYDRSRRAETV